MGQISTNEISMVSMYEKNAMDNKGVNYIAKLSSECGKQEAMLYIFLTSISETEECDSPFTNTPVEGETSVI